MSEAVSSSFRDPSGFVFTHGGVVHRQVNLRYRDDYDTLMGSGLYDALVASGDLIPHEEVALEAPGKDAYKVLRPEQLAAITYPYEWCFSQLKDAALLTLAVQRKALDAGMSLKDASAYNVQFHDGRPVFMDTLSFERYRKGTPWPAYKQFCEHFLAPLALMARTDVSLGQLLRTNIDGVPLPLASRLLPWRSRFSFSLGVHIHVHAKTQSRSGDRTVDRKPATKAFSRTAFLGLLDSLRNAVQRLDWSPADTEWFDYYESNNNYSPGAMGEKERLVDEVLARANAAVTWDLGANTGRFSQFAARHGTLVWAWDVDPACVELHYRALRKSGERRILPLLLDLTNPSPAIGWDNAERMSLGERSPADMALALGLIHHLAIANNVPLPRIASFLARTARQALVEFVPKSDSQVEKLLRNREDIFPGYEQQSFEAIFSERFHIQEVHPIPGSERTLYWLRVK